jgi:hypothetical protein
MAFERLWGRGSRGGLTKLHRTKREGGSDRRDGLDEIAARGHALAPLLLGRV